MTKSICIMGKGRSHVRIKEFADSVDEVILCNMGDDFIHKLKQDEEIIDILKEKECILFCNTSKVGFTKLAFDTFNVKKCVVNRVKPTENWELWRLHKATQTKGLWYHDENIPAVKLDLPYFFKWRGPAEGTVADPRCINWPTMTMGNGMNIEHLSEGVEMYLFEPTRDRLETNMGLYYTALYSIIDAKKDHLIYCGIDFYDKMNDGYRYHPGTLEKHRMEGAHMKILLKDYLARYFSDVHFELYTSANIESDKKNITINRKEMS